MRRLIASVVLVGALLGGAGAVAAPVEAEGAPVLCVPLQGCWCVEYQFLDFFSWVPC